MERGPYGRPPGEPGYPARDPAYAQPPPPPEYYEPPRRVGFAEVAAILALVGAVVAILLALDARDEGSDDEQVARQVRQETRRQVEQVSSSLGQKAGTARARARQAEAEAEANRKALLMLRTQVAALRGEMKTLRTQQNQTRDTLRNLSETVSKERRQGG